MSTAGAPVPMPHSDPLAGSALSGRRSYPIYHRGVHGSLEEIIGPAYALISIGVDTGPDLDPDDLDFLQRLGTRIIRMVPPDDDGRGGYCDLDFAYTAYLAGRGRHVVLVRPDGTIQGSAASLAGLPALVAGLRRELADD